MALNDHLLDDLRRALRREMLVGEWNLGRGRDGGHDLVVSEFTRASGVDLRCGITFVIARWHSTVRRGEAVARTYRTPLTVSTVVWVEYPAAAALLAQSGGVAGPPLVERFLDRTVVGPSDGVTDAGRSHGVTDVPGLTAVAGAARELAERAHTRGGTIIARFSTVDDLVAEWRGTTTVEASHEREWVPVSLAASGRRDDALAALRGYVRSSGPSPVDERYRRFADALTLHVGAG